MVPVACAQAPPADEPAPDAGRETEAVTEPARDAEVAFMQDMIPHHVQALQMASLAPDRARHAAVGPLARRIDAAQRAEVAMMRRWIEEHGEQVPGLLAGHGHGDDMPGMLTEDEILELDDATGTEFDRLFLERMIEHHRGALTMVDELYASGELEDLELAQFAHRVESDQRFEIRQMQDLLERIDG